MRLWYFSSSINSFFKRDAKPSNGARCLIFGRTLHLLPDCMCANSEGSGETGQMRRLAWAFTGCLYDKYHISWAGSYGKTTLSNFRIFTAIFFHTLLTRYYIRLLFYNIFHITLRFSQRFPTKCIGYNTMCIGTHRIWLRNCPHKDFIEKPWLNCRVTVITV